MHGQIVSAGPLRVLEREDWITHQRAHEARVDAWIEPRNQRKSRGEKHPVYDFLFEYYSYRPAALRRWHPGLGLCVRGRGSDVFAERVGYLRGADGCVRVDPCDFKVERRTFTIRTPVQPS